MASAVRGGLGREAGDNSPFHGAAVSLLLLCKALLLLCSGGPKPFELSFLLGILKGVRETVLNPASCLRTILQFPEPVCAVALPRILS